ncbi:nicotinate phosphoribosyltransferase [Streptomyces sp. NPDC014676]|uniref:nicotinate phosphoribosyltransferase n=1 Tax=Streptomyces sp. NPDC014676 TaxID=3364879 RepID=UPI0036F9C6E1
MSDATTTDLYEVTMAMSYLQEGMTGPATFSLFVRDLPAERGFLVAAGLESALDHLSGLHVGPEDIDAFASALHRPPSDLRPLLGLEFTGDVRAVPEGRIVLAGEPLLEVTAPLPQAQLAETYVLNQLSHQTAVASKAARCVLAAAGRPVVDFSLRRTHGPQAGFQAARLGAMTGFAGTSNVAAATALGLTAVGTMAHSFVEAFATEEDAFRAFARCHPGPVTLLVDTYATEEGVRVAARVLRDLDHAARGPGSAVRLDSGDLGALAVRARSLLDDAGLPDVRIVASGGLDEYAVDELVRSGAPIDIYAVGTRVGVSADAPYLDSAYKLVEYDGRPVMKLSSAKVTAPGPKQVFRRPGCVDVITLADEQPPDGGTPLLETVIRGGRRTGAGPTLDECRERFTADLGGLPPAARRIRAPVAPRATASERLGALAARVRRRIEQRTTEDSTWSRVAERTVSGPHGSVPR